MRRKTLDNNRTNQELIELVKNQSRNHTNLHTNNDRESLKLLIK